MTGKKVSFVNKPSNQSVAPVNAEEWVKNRDISSEEPIKRLTLDIPESLHRAIKVSCAGRGVKMAEEIRLLLEENYKKP